MTGFQFDLWSWLLNTVPWWAQLIVLAVVVLVPAYLLVAMIWGREAANRLLLPGIGILAALAAASKLRQGGYNDRRAEEERALDHAEEVHDEIETRVETMPDDQLHRETDRWTRK